MFIFHCRDQILVVTVDGECLLILNLKPEAHHDGCVPVQIKTDILDIPN